MTALATDANRVYELGDINQVPVKASAIIYQGAAVGGHSSGYARPIANGDKFLGFADEKIDNSGGGDGIKTVRVRKRGAILLDISGVALGDIGKSVYATDDNTFTLSDTNAVYIGQISRIDSSDLALVEFDVAALPPVAA
jgi:hypothetical protein